MVIANHCVYQYISFILFYNILNIFKIEFLNDWENNLYIDDILVDGTIGVKEVNPDASVNIFPNPSNGNFNVIISNNNIEPTDIVVYNMIGEEVDHLSHHVLYTKQVKINLENQCNGVYFVKVKTDNGSITKKLILNK